CCEGSMRGGAGSAANRQQQDRKRDDRSHQGFGISLTPGAGHLPSCAGAAPSAGISIQRLTPCSHSCTTGKYSVVFGLSVPVSQVLITNAPLTLSGSLPPLQATSLIPSETFAPS